MAVLEGRVPVRGDMRRTAEARGSSFDTQPSRDLGKREGNRQSRFFRGTARGSLDFAYSSLKTRSSAIARWSLVSVGLRALPV